MNLITESLDGLKITYSPKEIEYKNFLVFIHGGGIRVGKDKFKKWQEILLENGIGSLSFDFHGVGSSLGDISENNLEKRIQITFKIIDWVHDNFKYKSLSAYGVSMGGYVVLGSCFNNEKISKIISHTPAAYAVDAHSVNFGEAFTKILRTKDSWKNSMSFDWLNKIDKPVFIITHTEDDVVPEEINNAYKEIVSSFDNGSYFEIKDAKHCMSVEQKEEVILKMIDFLVS